MITRKSNNVKLDSGLQEPFKLNGRSKTPVFNKQPKKHILYNREAETNKRRLSQNSKVKALQCGNTMLYVYLNVSV